MVTNRDPCAGWDDNLDYWVKFVGGTFAFASTSKAAWADALRSRKVTQAEFLAAVEEARQEGRREFTPANLMSAVSRQRAAKTLEDERQEASEYWRGFNRALDRDPTKAQVIAAGRIFVDASNPPAKRLEAAREILELTTDPVLRTKYRAHIDNLEREIKESENVPERSDAV